MIDLSVVVCFYNMRREAARTLLTLSRSYQRGVEGLRYEVMAVDNGSAAPLQAPAVQCHGPEFQLIQVAPGNPSPCAAINAAVKASRGRYVMVCIDGARMLSPGILALSMQAARLHEHPFIYTLGMHLGPKPQNESMAEGYDQGVEDELLASVDWQADGYELFRLSSVAYSSFKGFFSSLSESNCFMLRRDDYLDLGGLDPAFASAGGGLVNLDFFNRAHECRRLQPVMLLGEASFHQFHGGVATNVPASQHPWGVMEREYRSIRGRPFVRSGGSPLYLGRLDGRYHAGLANFDASQRS